MAVAFGVPLIACSTGIIALAVLTTTTRGETESWLLATVSGLLYGHFIA